MTAESNHEFHSAFPAPELVVYDNCCNLHQYCLNRDPAFSKTPCFLLIVSIGEITMVRTTTPYKNRIS